MLYISLSFAALLVGIVLWRVGRRGSRLDDHPICIKCGYDLVGLPSESLCCSECGADIKANRAVRIGNRRSRRGMMWTGLTLALLALPVVGLSSVNWWQHFNTLPWLPLSFLEREYKIGNPDAMRELESRVAHGRLSKGQATQLLRDMTAWQDDPSVKIFWGFDIVSGHRGDLLHTGVDPALLDAYEDHPYRIDAKNHAKIVRNTFFPFRLVFDVRPVRDMLLWEREIENTKARVQVENDVFELKSQAELPLSQDAYERDSLIMGTDAPEFWRHEHNGHIDGTLTVEADILEGQPSPRHVVRSIPFSAEVLTLESPTIIRVSNPALDAEMAAAFHADAVKMDNQGRLELWRILPGFCFRIGTLPENVAMEVHFEQAGHRWNQGVLIRGAGRVPVEMYLTPRLERPQPPDDTPRYFIGLPWRRGLSFMDEVPTDVRPDLPLELVLTSSPDLATSHSGFDRVWQGEIRMPIPITIHTEK
ncbi:MAG TPA: hypothetical protein VGN88_03405 [Phycisphaerae bacterium]|jgi:hypothetical protein